MKKINWKELFKVFLLIVKILGTIIVVLFMPIVLNWIIEILLHYEIIEQSYDERILNFYATIIGGLLTLLGVWITIKHENETKKEDDLIKYKPILEVCGVNEPKMCILREVKLGMPFFSYNDDPEKETKYEKFNKQLEDNTIHRILIQNKGRGETSETTLDCFKCTNTNWDKDNTLLYSATSGKQYVGEILKDNYFGIDIILPNYMFMPEKQEGLLRYELTTKIIISYSDMFNKMKYKYEIYTKFKVSVERFEEEQPYFYKDGFKYAKVSYNLVEIMPSKEIYSNKRK